MNLDLFLQYMVAGVTYGTIYGIVAVGFNIIYNATGIINFAQGEFVMLGGMTAVTLGRFLPLPAAILGAVLITMVVGALLEILFIRWLHRPSVLRMIVITIGLSILIRETALHIWGEGVRALPYFTGTSVTSIRLGGVYISPQVLWVVGISAVVVAILGGFFRFTLLGMQMRACSANRDAARLCGISAKNMVTLSFMLSAGIGALGGCIVSPITLCVRGQSRIGITYSPDRHKGPGRPNGDGLDAMTWDDATALLVEKIRANPGQPSLHSQVWINLRVFSQRGLMFA